MNKVSAAVHTLCGVKQRITSAYHPKSNGLTERNNRTIQCGMLRILEGRQEEWPKVLPGVLFAYRTSVQESTRYTPFFLMYGRQAKLPLEAETSETVDIEEQPATAVPDDSAEEEIKARLDVIDHVRNTVSKNVSENISIAQDKQKRDYAKRHGKKKAFVEGDFVLLWNLRRSDQKEVERKIRG